MPSVDPIKLANSMSKSRVPIFDTKDGKENEFVQDVNAKTSIMWTIDMHAESTGTSLMILLEYTLPKLEFPQTQLHIYSTCSHLEFQHTKYGSIQKLVSKQ